MQSIFQGIIFIDAFRQGPGTGNLRAQISAKSVTHNRSEVSLGGARCTLGPGIALGLDLGLAGRNTGG